MPTVIDSLIVELGIDPKGVESGRKKAAADFLKARQEAEDEAKRIEEAGKRSARFFSQMQTAAIELFAVFTGGRSIKDFIQSIISTDVQVGLMSKTLDESTEQLSAWQNIMKLNGGTADDATSSIQSLVSQFQTFAITGDSTVIPYFRALGVQITDAHGRMRDMTALLLDLSKAFRGMDPARAAAFGRAMGLTQGMVNVLIQGPAAVQRMLDRQRQLGNVTAEDAKQALALARAWGEAAQAATTLGRNITTYLTPALVQFFHNAAGLFSGQVPTHTAEDFFTRLMFDPGSFFAPEPKPTARPKPTAEAAPVSSAVPPQGRALLQAIGSPESGGAYDVEYGGTKFSSFADHPNQPHRIVRGPNVGKVSTAAGRYQMTIETWREAQRALGLKDFSPESQDRAAWWVAQRDYRERTGRSLSADLSSGDRKLLAGIATTLARTWTSLPSGAEQTTSLEGFVAALAALSPVTPAAAAPLPTARAHAMTVAHATAPPRRAQPTAAPTTRSAAIPAPRISVTALERRGAPPALARQPAAAADRRVAPPAEGPRRATPAAPAPRTTFLAPLAHRAVTTIDRSQHASMVHTETHETHIGKIEVATKATDARGIAKDLGPAIKRNALATHANAGSQ